MENKYFSEIYQLAQDYDKYWHRRYYEVHVRGGRYCKNFNDYYQQELERRNRAAEKYNDPNRVISEEKQKMIRDAITFEKVVKKDGIEFSIFTHKQKRYKDLGSLEDLLLGKKIKTRACTIYVTSVITCYEEKVGEYYKTATVENMFSSIAKSKATAQKDFEKTCEMIDNSTCEEIINKFKNEIKKNKINCKKRFEEELEEKKKQKELFKKELEEIRRKREIEKSKK